MKITIKGDNGELYQSDNFIAFFFNEDKHRQIINNVGSRDIAITICELQSIFTRNACKSEGNETN
jgi:hypothetical protein